MAGNKNSGRRRKSHTIAGVQQVLDGTATRAAQILDDHINRRKGWCKISASLQRACEYVIDHAIGKARLKVEHSGGVMTYNELSESAKELDKHPRPILADVEEIAQKYQEKTALAAESPPEGPENPQKTKP